MTKPVLVFDYDWLIFKAAPIAEERFLRVLNKKTQEEHIFKNRTEIYGRKRSRDGGWLALQEDLTLEDLEIEQDRDLLPISHALNRARQIIERTCKILGAEEYYGYVSGEGNFRKDICTLLEYKGNRKDTWDYFYRKDIGEYLVQHHKAIRTEGMEPDDTVTMDMHKALKEGKNLVGVINEKDYYGCNGNWFHYDLEKLIKIRGFGELYRKGSDVKGHGRLWKYFQVCWEDSSDNYQARCHSHAKENGQVSVYNKLKDCKDDKEAFEVMKEHFQWLYPEPKEVTNWKGDTFEIDWLYVMQEMFNMAHLLRFEGDKIDVKKTMEKLGVGLWRN